MRAVCQRCTRQCSTNAQAGNIIANSHKIITIVHTHRTKQDITVSGRICYHNYFSMVMLPDRDVFENPHQFTSQSKPPVLWCYRETRYMTMKVFPLAFTLGYHYNHHQCVAFIWLPLLELQFKELTTLQLNERK